MTTQQIKTQKQNKKLFKIRNKHNKIVNTQTNVFMHTHKTKKPLKIC